MNELMDTVNQLQQVFLLSDCKVIHDLPQIVVIGTQSSGKSSVLEHLVGKSFLPRGPGIVTRCPLVLQMMHAPGMAEGEWYAVFDHEPKKKFTEEQSIAKQIEGRTEELSGSNKGISKTPIFLKMYSSSFLDLTLVDLPGLTKVPVGDQPNDIGKQIKELVMEYINKDNSIILAVSAANVDIAASDSLKRAKEADPEGLRTLAVITKLDLMDSGTDAWDILRGDVIPVKLGIIGVVNRSQDDINKKKSIKESIEYETRYLNEHYRSIANLHGCSYLRKTIQGILIKQIKKSLPDVSEKINKKLGVLLTELKSFGDMNLDQIDSKNLLLSLITKFSSEYCSAINGDSFNILNDQLCVGARIKYKFVDTLSDDLKSIDPLEGLTESKVLSAMENATGANQALFVAEKAFELLVKNQMKRLRDPCLQCVNLVLDELQANVHACMENTDLGLHQYPTFQTQVCACVKELLEGRRPITTCMVDNFIDIQLNYINNGHPDFLPNQDDNLIFCLLGGIKQRKDNEEKFEVPPEQPAEHDANQMTEMLSDLSEDGLDKFLKTLNFDKMRKLDYYILFLHLIKRYFLIVRKTTLDIVPKLIMHFLVDFVIRNIHSELVLKLLQNDVSRIVSESTAITERKQELKQAIATLEQGKNILSRYGTPNGK